MPQSSERVEKGVIYLVGVQLLEASVFKKPHRQDATNSLVMPLFSGTKLLQMADFSK